MRAGQEFTDNGFLREKTHLQRRFIRSRMRFPQGFEPGFLIYQETALLNGLYQEFKPGCSTSQMNVLITELESQSLSLLILLELLNFV